jgi:hypothetical protein
LPYYGNAAGCTAYAMDKADFNAALKNPDGALWSLSPQSGTIIDTVTPKGPLPMMGPGNGIWPGWVCVQGSPQSIAYIAQVKAGSYPGYA